MTLPVQARMPARIQVPGPRRRTLRAYVVAGLTAGLVLLAVLGTAAPASAHATLVSSDPVEGSVLTETPDVVTFTFDESVSLPPDGVQVFDAAGDPVDAEAASRDTVITADLPDTLEQGSYVVVWRAISADGHPIAGSLTFAIGRASATVAAPNVPDAEQGSVRTVLGITHGIGYVGLLLAAGLVLFLAWAVRDVRLDDAVRGRVEQTLWAATGVALLAGAFALPLTGAYQQGLGLASLGETVAVDPALIGDDLIVLGLQTAGLLTALAVLRRPRLTRFAAAGAVVAVVSPALVGHSRAIEPVWLLVSTDVIHLLAGASWLGGLVGLALVLRSLAGSERDAALVLARFSEVAGGLLLVLAVTGTLMAWRILEGWAPLVHTTYGRLLLVKIGLALAVAAIAGWNRFRLLPRVRDGVGHAARRGAVLRVGTVVRYEAGLIVALLGVTGFLVNQSPRDDAAAARAPVASRVEVGVVDDDLKVLATASPGTRGPNTVTIQVQDGTGEPVEGYAAPTLVVRSATAATDPGGVGVDLGAVAVVPVAAGTYSAEVVLPTPGTWVLQVGLRRSEFDNPVTPVEVEIR